MSTKTKILKNLNIETLFSTNNNKPHTNGKLDINTLFKSNNDNQEMLIDPDSLLNGMRKRQLKLEEIHGQLFKNCWKTIMEANDTGITDIFYEVPEHIIECINYDPKKCMKFIKEKLSEQCIQSVIIKNKNKNKLETSMFITWVDLEKRLKEKSEKDKTEKINTSSVFD